MVKTVQVEVEVYRGLITYSITKIYVHMFHLCIVYNIEILKGLFRKTFCDKGDPKRRQQEQAYIHFIDFMEECAGMWQSSNMS